MRRLLFATAALLASSAAAHAFTFTFTTIDNPADPAFNQLLGIDNAGTIVGYYGSGAAGHPNQGYSIAAPYQTYVPVAYPGSVQTQATSINGSAHAITGFWSNTNLGAGDANYGFIQFSAKGQVSYEDVNDPRTTSSPPVNQVLGINLSRIAVGFYNDANNASHAYTFDATANTFRDVLVGDTLSVTGTGINNSGLVCGYYVNKVGWTVGFVKNQTSGVVARVRLPNITNTQLYAINNRGRAVGFYIDANGLSHGLLYTPGRAGLTTVDNPAGVKGSALNGINDNNQAVGYYTDSAGAVHGMLVAVAK